MLFRSLNRILPKTKVHGELTQARAGRDAKRIEAARHGDFNPQLPAIPPIVAFAVEEAHRGRTPVHLFPGITCIRADVNVSL